MEPEKLAQLIEKYLSGNASPEESEALLAWYRSVDNATIEVPLHSEKERESLGESMRAGLLKYANREAGISITSHRSNDITSRRPNSFTPRRSNRWLIAATLSGLVIAGGWLYYAGAKKTPAPPAPVAKVKEIKPGGNRAILTLDDGTQVVLDNASQGILASQGATTIEKTADGKLVYRPGGNASGGILHNRMETPRGGEYQLTLSDGTRVWLNSATTLRYPSSFTGNTREVEVTGEAYFDVAEDKARPFIVSSGNTKIQVLGTSFNLMAYQDEEAVKTTLVSGAVKILQHDQACQIKPGQQAVANAKGSDIKVRPVDIDRAIAWKNGVFDFEGADIRSIMRQVARWYDVEVRYEGDLSGIVLSGVVSRREKVDLLLEALGRTREVQFKIEGKQITVMPAGN